MGSDKDRLAIAIEALKCIIVVAEFHAQNGVSERTMRYAHRDLGYLAQEALDEIYDRR